MLEHEPSFSTIAAQRNFSKFLCKEMLFDYLTGRLDPLRAKAVEAQLEKHDDLKSDKKLIEASLRYCADLSISELGQEFAEKVFAPLTIIDLLKKYLNIKHWPTPLKWGLEAFVVSSLVATIILVFFWTNIQRILPAKNETILVTEKIKREDTGFEITDRQEIAAFKAQIESEKAHGDEDVNLDLPTPAPKPVEVAAQPVPKIEPTIEPKAESKPEPKIEPKLPKPEPKVEAKPEIKPAPKIEMKPEPKPTPTVTSKPTPAVVTEPTPNDMEAESEAAPVAAESPPQVEVQAPMPRPTTTAKRKGYVYKLFMHLDNLDVLGVEIANKIIELGGVKAGEVEIGWRKPNGSYYHFMIGKEAYQPLIDYLKTHGPVQIVKDPHDRVMPDGQERYILWIEGS